MAYTDMMMVVHHWWSSFYHIKPWWPSPYWWDGIWHHQRIKEPKKLWQQFCWQNRPVFGLRPWTFLIISPSPSILNIPQKHTDLGLSTLSRTPLAQFSWESKPDIRSSGFTATYLLEMFFSTREKCCYMLIFANECAVLIKVFINVFEATPFFAVLYRWRKYEILAFNVLHFLGSL